MLLLLSFPFLLMHEDLASIAPLLRKQEPCLRKEAFPSHFLRAVCDRQMNNINSPTKGRIRQQIESSSYITEATIKGMASIKECLYGVWDRLQNLYELREKSERESLSQHLQEKYKGAHTCRERKKPTVTQSVLRGRSAGSQLLMFRRAKLTFHPEKWQFLPLWSNAERIKPSLSFPFHLDHFIRNVFLPR